MGMRGGMDAKHSEKPADLAPGRARLTPRWMTAPDSSGTPWHDLAQGKVTVCYFVSTSHMTRDYPCDPDTKLGGSKPVPQQRQHQARAQARKKQ